MNNNDFIFLYSNPKIQKLMNKIGKKFKIPKDELEQCKRIALWKVTKKKINCKFSTALYNEIKWECLKYIKENSKNKQELHISKDHAQKNNSLLTIDILDELNRLPDGLGLTIYNRFYKNYTLKSISELENCCIETVRRNIMKGLSLLKKNLSKS